MSPADIEELFKSSPLAGDGTDLSLMDGDRVEKLRDVLRTVEELLATDSDDLELVAQKIGDGSRNGKPSRICV